MKEHLNKHEVQRFMVLKNINTDAGRGRAWLRSTFNEHSLEKYTHMLLENDKFLRYEICFITFAEQPFRRS